MSNPYAPPPAGRRAGERGGTPTSPTSEQQPLPPSAEGPVPPGAQRPLPPGAQRPLPPGAQRPLTPGPQRPLPPGARPPAGPPPRPVAPEDVRRASRRVMDFGLLLLATLLVASLPLPWSAAALAFAIGTVVVGVRALRSVARAGLRGTLLPMLGVGLVLALLLSVYLASMLALWPLQVQRQECLQGALTIASREQCETQFEKALQDRLENATLPGGAATRGADAGLGDRAGTATDG